MHMKVCSSLYWYIPYNYIILYTVSQKKNVGNAKNDIRELTYEIPKFDLGSPNFRT